MPPRVASTVSLCSSTNNDVNQNNDHACRLGFIGTGVITSAIVTGLATQTAVKVSSVAVSRRSAAKSAALLESFPELVTVHDYSQELVDQSDIIFLAVLPQQAEDVLKGIQFDQDRHILVSLVSTSNLDGLSRDSGLPKECVYKMICLPAVSTQDGVCLLTPPTNNDALLAVLESLGGVVQAETEQQMAVMMVPSGLMGSFYGILKNNRDWLVKQGISQEKASFLVGRQYHAMMVDAENRCCDPDAFEELIQEQTPGGLNEQALANLAQLGAFQMYEKTQDALLARILGQTDGSLGEDDGR